MRSDMSSEAQELVLFADNDAALYRQSYQPTIQNLRRKVAKGQYNPALAVKLWAYHAERAAKAYEKEFLNKGEWSRVFPPAVRREAAQHWESETRTAHPNDDAYIGLTSHDMSRSPARRRRRRPSTARRRR